MKKTVTIPFFSSLNENFQLQNKNLISLKNLPKKYIIRTINAFLLNVESLAV